MSLEISNGSHKPLYTQLLNINPYNLSRWFHFVKLSIASCNFTVRIYYSYEQIFVMFFKNNDENYFDYLKYFILVVHLPNKNLCIVIMNIDTIL